MDGRSVSDCIIVSLLRESVQNTVFIKRITNKETELKRLIAGSCPSSPTIEDRMKSPTVDVVSPGTIGGSRVGDSGYMSCGGGQHDTILSATVPAPAEVGSSHCRNTVLVASEYHTSSIVEAHLMPHLLQGMLSFISSAFID
jgi:hypothetical protein